MGCEKTMAHSWSPVSYTVSYDPKPPLVLCVDLTRIPNEPEMSVDDFVMRALQSARLSTENECAVLQFADCYFEAARVKVAKLIRKRDLPSLGPYANSLLSSRQTFIASLVLARKFLVDEPPNMRRWADRLGVALEELSGWESGLVHALESTLWVGGGTITQ